MALIFCPECLNEISDKSETCIHCGYPLNTPHNKEPDEDHLNVCPKCGRFCVTLTCPDCSTKMVNTSYSKDFRTSSIKAASIRETWDKERSWENYLREKYVIGSEEFNEELYNKRLEEEAAYNKSMDEELAKAEAREKSRPKCPTCGSTNIEKISLGSKAVSGFFFGLFSSDVRNSMRCKNCGYKW